MYGPHGMPGQMQISLKEQYHMSSSSQSLIAVMPGDTGSMPCQACLLIRRQLTRHV